MFGGTSNMPPGLAPQPSVGTMRKNRIKATIHFRQALLQGPVKELQDNIADANVKDSTLVKAHHGMFHFLLDHDSAGNGVDLDHRPGGERFKKVEYVLSSDAVKRVQEAEARAAAAKAVVQAIDMGPVSAGSAAAAAAVAVAAVGVASAWPVAGAGGSTPAHAPAPGLVAGLNATDDSEVDNLRELQLHLGMFDEHGRKPIHAAIAKGEVRYADTLIYFAAGSQKRALAEHASLCALDKSGRTILHHAAANGIKASTLIRLLKVLDENNIPIGTGDQYGRNALHAAVEYLPPSTDDATEDATTTYESLNTLATSKDENGAIPLHRAWYVNARTRRTQPDAHAHDREARTRPQTLRYAD